MTSRRMVVAVLAKRWKEMSRRQRMLGIVSVLIGYNIYLEKSGVFRFHWSLSLFHAVVYAVRKTITSVFFRHHPYWNTLEEIALSTVRFFARISNVTGPRAALKPLIWLGRQVEVLVGRAKVTHKDLGLGHGPNDSVWITLEEEHDLHDQDLHIILYFHGGGFAIGSADMYVGPMARWLSKMKHQGVKAGILSIEYPLAPEAKFPVPLEWAKNAFEKLVFEFDVDPSRIIIGGDSAGGALAIVSGLHAQAVCEKHNLTKISGLVLLSPWVEHGVESESHQTFLEIDYISGADVLGKYSEAYCGDVHTARSHPEISVIQSDAIHALPPLMVTCGNLEVFRDDIAHFCRKAKEFGIHVSEHVGEAMPHIHPLLWPLFYEKSDKALGEIANWCTKQFKPLLPAPPSFASLTSA